MSKPLSERARKLQEEWGLSCIFTRKLDEALADEREKVRKMCARHMYNHLASRSAQATSGKYNNPTLAAEMSGLAIGLKAEILNLDLTGHSKETRRAEMFCNQCQGYVNVLAAPDHLKTHPEHTMRLRWYPPADESGEEKV